MPSWTVNVTKHSAISITFKLSKTINRKIIVIKIITLFQIRKIALIVKNKTIVLKRSIWELTQEINRT